MRPSVLNGIHGLAATVLLLGPGASHSEVVFSNLGPGDTYDCCWGWAVYGTDAPIRTDRASPFVPLIDYTLDSIDIALTHAGSANSAQVWLLSDEGGLPGAILESFLLADLPTFQSTNNVLASATSTLNLHLMAGSQYWVAASAVGSSQFSFNWNVTGDTGLASRDNSGPWGGSSDTFTAVAFRVNGTPVTTVPEPGTLALLGLGLAGLGLSRRRLAR